MSRQVAGHESGPIGPWTRDAFAEVAPWCAAHGAAFLPFAPLGRGGVLTGALAPQKLVSE